MSMGVALDVGVPVILAVGAGMGRGRHL